MNEQLLLDAIGMVDDDLLMHCGRSKRLLSPRKIVALLVAAVLITLTVGVATASTLDKNSDLWKFWSGVFRIFQLETKKVPPGATVETTDSTEEVTATTEENTDESLAWIGAKQIDGAVDVHYFEFDGYISIKDGAFYTCTEGGPLKDGCFWKVTEEGVVSLGAKQVRFSVQRGENTLNIMFDYAVVNNRMAITFYVSDMDKGPYGYAWAVDRIGNRTDAVLLSLPRSVPQAVTREYYVLDLATLEMRNLLENIQDDTMIVDYEWMTEDLRYALLHGAQRTAEGEFIPMSWLCDLEKQTKIALKELLGFEDYDAFFVDADTVACFENLNNGRQNIYRYKISTGEKKLILDNVSNTSADPEHYRRISKINGSIYGTERFLLYCKEDGGVETVDLLTSERMLLGNIDLKAWRINQNTEGTGLLLLKRFQVENGKYYDGAYTAMGMLNPRTGTVLMLKRTPSRYSETMIFWADEYTVGILTKKNDSEYYAYLYSFANE